MPKLSTITAFVFLLILTNCTNVKEAQLLGNWQGISWIVDGQESGRNAGEVLFLFENTGIYEGAWGEKMEKGVFELKGDKLYTTEEGKLKKMVEISFSGVDTLVFQMNRMGTDEQLILVRK